MPNCVITASYQFFILRNAVCFDPLVHSIKMVRFFILIALSFSTRPHYALIFACSFMATPLHMLGRL